MSMLPAQKQFKDPAVVKNKNNRQQKQMGIKHAYDIIIPLKQKTGFKSKIAQSAHQAKTENEHEYI